MPEFQLPETIPFEFAFKHALRYVLSMEYPHLLGKRERIDADYNDGESSVDTYRDALGNLDCDLRNAMSDALTCLGVEEPEECGDWLADLYTYAEELGYDFSYVEEA